MNGVTVAQAIGALVDLTNIAASAAAAAQKAGAVIQKAQAEGRAELTVHEWASIRALDDEARGTLEAAIARRAAAG